MTTAKQAQTFSLRDFWNSVEVESLRLFAVSTAIPTGKEYRHGGEGEDYCDLHELIDSGLSTADLWPLIGFVGQEGTWTWDGAGNVRDHRGNSYTKIQVGRQL